MNEFNEWQVVVEAAINRLALVEVYNKLPLPVPEIFDEGFYNHIVLQERTIGSSAVTQLYKK